MRETQEIQLFTVTFNTVKYTKSELMGKMPWHSQEPDFSFSLSLFLPELLCILCYFWNKVLWFFFFFFPKEFRKPSSTGHSLYSLFTVCRWKNCQFAAQNFGSYSITTNALCTERNDTHVFGWRAASQSIVLWAAEFPLWGSESLSTLQNWASNEACLLHAVFSK